LLYYVGFTPSSSWWVALSVEKAGIVNHLACLLKPVRRHRMSYYEQASSCPRCYCDRWFTWMPRMLKIARGVGSTPSSDACSRRRWRPWKGVSGEAIKNGDEKRHLTRPRQRGGMKDGGWMGEVDDMMIPYPSTHTVHTVHTVHALGACSCFSCVWGRAG
jgi:hypothetical protein